MSLPLAPASSPITRGFLAKVCRAFTKEFLTPATGEHMTKTTALVLRCCRSDMSSKNGFVWPALGEAAIAPDWINNNECGNGLHGWLYGAGEYISGDMPT